MKTFTSLLVILFTSVAMGQLGPVKGKGQSQSTFNTIERIEVPASQMTVTGDKKVLIETGELNFLVNPGFEPAIASSGWTASAGTAALATGENIAFGNKSITWTPNASGDTFMPGLVSVPAGLKGANAEASLWYKSTAAGHSFLVLDENSNIIAGVSLPASVSYSRYPLNFVAPSNLNASVRPQVRAGSTTAISMDQFRIGDPTNIGTVAQAIVIGTAEQAGASNCSFSENTSSGESNYISLGSAGSCASAWTVTGGLTAPAATTSAQTFNNMPPGRYEISVAAPFLSDTSGVCNFVISDGTNSIGYINVGNTANNTGGVLIGTVNYTTAANRTFNIQASDTHAGSCFALNNVVGRKIVWTFKYFPTEQRAVSSNCIGTAACENIFSARVSSADAVSNENVDWISGNCTDATTGRATCLFNPGTFSVAPNCVAATSDSSGANQISCSIAGDANTAQVVVDCKSNATDSSQNFDIICQRVGADRRPGQAAPLLIGSVNSNSPGAERIERAELNCDASSSVTSQSGSWITAIGNRSSTACSITISSGLFATTPSCTFTVKGTTVQATAVNMTSTTAGTIYGPSADYDGYLTCIGPRL